MVCPCFFLWILFSHTHGVDAFIPSRRQRWWSSDPSSVKRGRTMATTGSGSSLLSSLFVDVVLENPLALLTPTTAAIVDDLIQKRDQARKRHDFELADALLRHISHDLELPSDCSIRVTDTTEGSEWSVLYHIPTDMNNNSTPSVLQLAHMTLGSRAAASEQHNWDPVALDNARDRLVQQAKERLRAWSRVHSKLSSLLRISNHQTFQQRDVPSIDMNREQWQAFLQMADLSVWASIESDLQGRKSADAAFWFALAGVVDEELFCLLTDVVCKELTRFGTRPSCRLKDVLSMTKRMAAAGVRHHKQLEQVVQMCLQAKDATMTSDAVVSFHSDGCALMLWEFSTRQRKQKSFLNQSARHWRNAEYRETNGPEAPTKMPNTKKLDWHQLFPDPHLPLVIDVGCGMGVCLLGLASLSGEEAWENRNFLGIDLNPVTIGYGSGMAQRWNLSDRLAFVVDAAESALQNVLESYPGSVSKILIQFPTPYRLNKPDSSSLGNGQLPSSATDGFMVSIELLRLCREILVRRNNHSGELWIQSNCEDVAVWMRKTACEDAGFSYSITDAAVQVTPDAPPVKETQRTLQWISMGGERAQGPGWCTTNILPRTAMTETEVACILKRTPVHRCILSLP